MATCFVIQPFDSGKFDKRYRDIYEPAIEAAGLEPYRVDKDPGVTVPIESIEKGIRQATLCLADITADNPNVWYELGYAFASARPIVMVCSEERTGKYPFDIQHRSVISYPADSPSDFVKLKESLTAKITAILKQDAVLDKIAASDPIVSVHGLSQTEILVIAVIAGEAFLPGQATTVFSVKRSAERVGITNMGFNLAVRRLLQKKYIFEEQVYVEHENESFAGLGVSETGWAWIDANDTNFVLRTQENDPDDVPF